MNNVRKILGIAWIVAGPLVVYYLVKTAVYEVSKNPVMDTWVQWIVFNIVFFPIAVGMVIFGYFALKGEYDEKV